MPPGTHSVSIESLPDPLLGRIFAAAGRQAGGTATLVSRRWHRVFFSEPDLWRELELTAESFALAKNKGKAEHWFAAKSRLLHRVGGFVQRLCYSSVVDDISSWQLSSSMLAHLSPATLQSLHFKATSMTAAAAAELQHLNGLTGLSITCYSPVPSCVVAALPSLPQLQSLQLRGDTLPLGLRTALPQLTQLTYLHCTAVGFPADPLPDLSTVFPLTRLRKLGWREQRLSGVLRVDVQQLLAHLPQLESWTFSSEMLGGRCMQIGGAQLAYCAVTGCDRAGGGCVEEMHLEEMHLSDIGNMSSLQQLVAAALPVATQPSQLRSLSMSHSDLPLPAVRDCAFLGHLTSLALPFCTFPGGSQAAGIEALLLPAPRLQRLTLQKCFHQEPVPRALLSRTGLRHLSLQSNALTELPDGPYLSSLVSLDLSSNGWTRLPPELAAATGLTALNLASNYRWALCDADLDSVLLRLPRLRRLFVDVGRTPQGVLARLAQAAPQISVSTDPWFEDWQRG